VRRVTTLLAVCAASLFAGAAPAAADNGPHVKGAGGSLTPDTCASCHRAHTAQAPYLLKESQTALCYTCHGSSGTGSSLDVEDGVGYSEHTRESSKKAGALRGGGFKYALIESNNPSGNGYVGEVPVRGSDAAVTSTHSVNESSQTTWGNGAINADAGAGNAVKYGKSISLTCGSCHDPHGNGNYRVLRSIPVESGVAEPGVKIPDVNITEEIEPGKFAKYNYTTENYWEVDDENAPNFIVNASAWCATCHTRYLAGSKSARTNSGDAVYTYRHRTNFASQGSPTCVQCHVAHGSNASMGSYSSAVPFPDGSSAGSDSRLLRIDNRGVCQMCHNK
jgi:predicted CXXCH cytochrome family protein